VCGDQIQLAWCLDDLGGIAVGRNDYILADTLVGQAQEIFETLGEQTNLAGILLDRGRYQEAMGNYTQALQYFQQSQDVSARLGLRLLMPHILSAASYTAVRLGDTRLGRQMRERSLEISVENQDLSGQIWGKWESGEIERIEGNLAEARRLYEESLQQFDLTPHSNIGAFYQRGLGEIALAQGNYGEARQRFLQSLEQAQLTYHNWSAAYALSGLGRAETGLGDWEAAGGYFRESLQKAEQTGSRGLIMVALAGLAELYAAQGDDRRAVELATFVTEQPATWAEFRRRAESVLQQCAARLPAAVAGEAQSRVRALDLETLLRNLNAGSG
jgi:tetratricopeptide (TPR) repeat protein